MSFDPFGHLKNSLAPRLSLWWTWSAWQMTTSRRRRKGLKCIEISTLHRQRDTHEARSCRVFLMKKKDCEGGGLFIRREDGVSWWAKWGGLQPVYSLVMINISLHLLLHLVLVITTIMVHVTTKDESPSRGALPEPADLTWITSSSSQYSESFPWRVVCLHQSCYAD